MINVVRKFIESQGLINRGDGIIVGLSGGADSVCLLKVLLCFREELDLRITAVHVNHHIRGEEALRDRNFAEELCGKWGVDIIHYDYDIPSLASEEGLGHEETGRKYRYIAFNDALNITNSQKIAVGHNKNDNAETIVQRLIRGTGLKGLGGIEPIRGNIIRPLLCVSREEIESFLGDEPYITDSTNFSEEYTRNKIRRRILADMKEINPSVVDVLYNMSELLRGENSYIENEAEKILNEALIYKNDNEVCLSCNVLKLAEPIIVSRALRTSVLPFTKKGQDIELKHIKSIKELIGGNNGRSIDLIEGIRARREFDRLFIGFERNSLSYKTEILPEKWTYIKEGNISVLISDNFLKNVPCFGIIDKTKVEPPFFLRTKKDGDKLPIKNGRQAVKKIYSAYKIPRSERVRYPLLTDSRGVIAVLGLKKGFGFFKEKGEGLFVYVIEGKFLNL